jgi:hypothetical protein
LYSIKLSDDDDDEPRVTHIDVSADKWSMKHLDATGAYIVDCDSELYSWIGKAASDARREALNGLAERALDKVELLPSMAAVAAPRSVRPAHARLLRLTQGAEPLLFREKVRCLCAHYVRFEPSSTISFAIGRICRMMWRENGRNERRPR